MTPEKTKRIMDACFLAKRVRDLLPPLPSGVAPSYITILENIIAMEGQNRRVKVSDLSEQLYLARPGITRTVKEMTARGYLTKQQSTEDGRVTYLSSTKKGRELSEKYDKIYFAELADKLSEITEEDADHMIRTVEILYRIMRDAPVKVK